jgi:hypothetical protein
MDADPSIVCGVTPAHLRMQVVGGVTLALYAVGMPVALGLFLFTNYSAVQSDQQLREKGQGDSALTNSHVSVSARAMGCTLCCPRTHGPALEVAPAAVTSKRWLCVCMCVCVYVCVCVCMCVYVCMYVCVCVAKITRIVWPHV